MRKIFYALPFAVLLFALTAISAGAAIAGDINGSGEPDVSDARVALREAIGLYDSELTDTMIDMTDYDYSGKTDIKDARLILRAAIRLDPVKHYFSAEAVTPASCTEAGQYIRTCTECTEEESFTQEVPALGHRLILSETVKEMTCTEDGSLLYKCSRCEYTEEKAIPATHNWNPATCTKPKTCSVCGEKEGKANGHSVKIGYCEICGEFVTELEKETKEIISLLNSALKHINNASAEIEEGASSGFTNMLIDKCKAADEEFRLAHLDLLNAYFACGEEKDLSEAKSIIWKLVNLASDSRDKLHGISDSVEKIEKEYKPLIEKDPNKTAEKNKKLVKEITAVLLKVDKNFEEINKIKYDLKDQTDKWKKK